MSILETAKQVVEWRTLAKTSGVLGKDGFARVRELIKLGFPETIYRNEAGIAAALVEAEKLLTECADWLCSRPDYTEGDAATASTVLAFLSRISTASTTYDAIREELKEPNDVRT